MAFVGLSSNDLQALYEQFKCPVTKTPLTQSDVLVPCICRVNDSVAKALFSKSPNTEKSEGDSKEQPQCPVCKKVVTAYYEDPNTRSIASKIFGNDKEEEELPKVSASIEADEKETSFEEIMKVPFPGKGAKFIVSGGNWKLHEDTGKPLVRNLELTSTVFDSLFSKVDVCGYRDGSIALFLNYREVSIDGVKKYFEEIEISLDDLASFYGTHFMIKDPLSLKRIYAILAKHNEIPAIPLVLIRSLVEQGDWTKVTPLKENEFLKPDRINWGSPDRPGWGSIGPLLELSLNL